MEAIINEKAMRGIERFLERRGMEILETGWAHGNDKIDFIAKDEDDLAFISCTIRTNEGNGLGAEALAYCAVFATPFHAPLLQRSMADCHVAMRVALIARGAQAPLLANTAGYALSRCACALTRRLQYG